MQRYINVTYLSSRNIPIAPRIPPSAKADGPLRRNLWLIGSVLYVYDIAAMNRARIVTTLRWLVPLCLGMAAAGVLLARSVTKPLEAFMSVLRRLAFGDIDTPIPGIGRRDEIG